MNISETYDALKDIAEVCLPDFAFYGMAKTQYNSVKTVTDVVIVEPPRQWPLNARNTCEAKFPMRCWIGMTVPLKPTIAGTLPHPPFNELEIRDGLMMAANVFLQAINASTNLRVVSDLNGLADMATVYDAPEGMSTNWQAWVNFELDVISYGTSEAIPEIFIRDNYFDYELDLNLS